MGLGDISAKVVTKYEADVKQHQGQIKKLSATEKKANKDNLKRIDATNSKLDTQIGTLAKVGIAVGALAVAYRVATKSLETYQHNSKLAAQTVGVDLAGLRKATNGLVDDTRLLEFAASGMNGTFKLSQKEMEQTARAAVVLRRGNTTLAESLDKIQRATEEGSTQPLKKLGVVIEGSKSGTSSGLRDVIGGLNKEIVAVGGNFDSSGDEVTRASVDMANAMDNIEHSIGKIVVALSPLITTLAKVLEGFAALAAIGSGGSQFTRDFVDFNTGTTSKNNAKLKGGLDASRQRLYLAELNRIQAQAANGGVARPGATAPEELPFPGLPIGATFTSGRKAKTTKKRKRGRGGGSSNGRNFGSLDGLESLLSTDIANGIRNGLSSFNAGAQDLQGRHGEALGARNDNIRAEQFAQAERETALTQDFFGMVQASQDRDSNVIQAIFGAPADIDARTVSITQLSGAFNGLAGSFGAGIDAMITGSDSFANAFKNAIGESMRALSVEMGINSIKHLGFGLASLAFLDGRGAAAHFAASAQFGAGAVAAGVGARLLGAGQAASPSAGSGTAPQTAGTSGVGTSSGADPGKGSTQIFIIGNDFEGMGARERQSQWRKTSRKAGIQIEGDAVVNG